MKCACGRGRAVSSALGKCEACLYEEAKRAEALEAVRAKQSAPAPSNVVPLRKGE